MFRILTVLYPLLQIIGVVPVTVGDADKLYSQDSDGWIEVLNSKNNTELTIILLFREKAFLKQLQFEGTSCLFYMCVCYLL